MNRDYLLPRNCTEPMYLARPSCESSVWITSVLDINGEYLFSIYGASHGGGRSLLRYPIDITATLLSSGLQLDVHTGMSSSRSYFVINCRIVRPLTADPGVRLRIVLPDRNATAIEIDVV